MGHLLRFPTRPAQAVSISRRSAQAWVVTVTSSSRNCANERHYKSEREAVAYAKGFCDATGFELKIADDHSRHVA